MAVKASDRVKFYKNKNGATVGSCDRKVFEVDGLYFKDIDGSEEFKDFDDWRNSPVQRAQKQSSVYKICQVHLLPLRNGLPDILYSEKIRVLRILLTG